MPKVTLYNQEGRSVGDVTLSEAVFAAKASPALVHQVYLALEANARESWADTKDRGEVRGGGKKPWKQKGTGRARHGSIRSPIWKGGGITFGPLSVRNYEQKVNKKMKQSAVRMCLSDKIADEKMFVVDQVQTTGKTKEVVAMRKALPGAGKSTLLLVDGMDDGLFLASRNIPQVHLQRAQDVNVVDLLHHQFVIATKGAVEALEKRLA